MPRRPTMIRDPLAPLSDAFLQRRRRRELRGITNPLIAEETRRINASAAAGARNIEGVTSRLADSLGGLEGKIGSTYDRSLSDLGALDTALADRLTAAGKTGGDELRKRLELSGSPMAQALVQGVEGTGAGAGAAQFGLGAAERSQLLANRASGQAFAAKLPGLARMAGAQDIGLLRAQRQRDLADRIGEINAQVPGLVQGMVSEDRRTEFDKAALLRGLGLDYAQLRQESAQFNRELAQRNRERREDRTQALADAKRERNQALADADREWQRSRKDAAAQRRYEARQRAIERRWEARQRALDRNSRSGDGGGSASGLGD